MQKAPAVQGTPIVSQSTSVLQLGGAEPEASVQKPPSVVEVQTYAGGHVGGVQAPPLIW